MKINTETLNGLIRYCRDDKEDLDMIVKAIESFEDYHRSIIRQEITRRLFSGGAIEAEDYRNEMTERDRSRTLHHNAVLAQVKILNAIRRNRVRRAPIPQGGCQCGAGISAGIH